MHGISIAVTWTSTVPKFQYVAGQADLHDMFCDVWTRPVEVKAFVVVKVSV